MYFFLALLAAIVAGWAPGCGGSGVADADFLIAFTNEHDLYLMSADGTKKRRLARDLEYVSGPAWSPDGQTIAFSGQMGVLIGDSTIHVMNANGSGDRTVTEPSRPEGSHHEPAWSPDGQMIAFRARTAKTDDIYVMNADGSALRNLTQTADVNELAPTWSPDGQEIAFARYRYPENGQIYVMKVDGSGLREVTPPSGIDWSSPAWSPDGSMIAGIDGDPFYGGDLYVTNVDGSGARNLTPSGDNIDWDPTWSPDGRMIAFSRDLGLGDHDPDIYVVNSDGSELRNLTEGDGEDSEPSWRQVEASED